MLCCRAAPLDASARRPYQKKLREDYGSSVKMHPIVAVEPFQPFEN